MLNKKVLILSISSALASTAFAGDIKPLHATLPGSLPLGNATTTYCDVYRMKSGTGANLLYTSAAVRDKVPVNKPKLGVKVGRWTGTTCAAANTAGQTHEWHVTSGGIAYDEGVGIMESYPHGPGNTTTGTLTQAFSGTSGSSPDGNLIMSKYSTMNYALDYCIQVCKYPSNQNVGTTPSTLLGAETYDLYAHSHAAAPTGHDPLNHYPAIWVSTLCNDLTPAACAHDW